MPRVLVTGSNRGLGLEWCRQYAETGWEVNATCRDPDSAETLLALGARYDNVSVQKLDVTEPGQIEGVRDALDGRPLDRLVNNAGVYFERWGRDPLGAIDYGDWEQTFRVNTLGPMRVTEALADNLAASERGLVATITSHMGSIADITAPSDYAYRSSKAALNAAMKGLTEALRARGVGVLLLHPGWVRTRMGGDSAPYSPEESVAGMRRLVEGFEPSQSGRFFKFDGSPLPW